MLEAVVCISSIKITLLSFLIFFKLHPSFIAADLLLTFLLVAPIIDPIVVGDVPCAGIKCDFVWKITWFFQEGSIMCQDMLLIFDSTINRSLLFYWMAL